IRLPGGFPYPANPSEAPYENGLFRTARQPGLRPSDGRGQEGEGIIDLTGPPIQGIDFEHQGVPGPARGDEFPREYGGSVSRFPGYAEGLAGPPENAHPLQGKNQGAPGIRSEEIVLQSHYRIVHGYDARHLLGAARIDVGESAGLEEAGLVGFEPALRLVQYRGD